MNFKRYLASREWALKKRAARSRSGGTCERCGQAPSAHVHHLTYERIGEELLEDLLDVCRGCHEWLSGGDYDPLDAIFRQECLSASWDAALPKTK